MALINRLINSDSRDNIPQLKKNLSFKDLTTLHIISEPPIHKNKNKILCNPSSTSIFKNKAFRHKKTQLNFYNFNEVKFSLIREVVHPTDIQDRVNYKIVVVI